MKVLVVVPALGPVYGGPSIIVPALAAALAEQGIAVDVAATDANGEERIDLPTSVWLEHAGYRTGYFRRLGTAEYKLSSSLLVWLIRHVHDYQVVHAVSMFNFPILACAIACRLRRVPLILNPQGMLEPWALRQSRRKKLLYYKLIEKPIVLRGATAIHALTAGEARNIAKLDPKSEPFVIPNGVDVDLPENDANDAEEFFKQYPAARNKKLILFLHRIHPKKGLDLLARAFALVRKRYPETYLTVAGPDLNNFGSLARKFFEDEGCGENVVFTGMLQGKMKRAAFSAASIFVAPSYSEGFSMSILEAMAAGLPCVMTTVCNFPEAASAGAALEVAVDAAAFAAALTNLIENPTEAEAIGRRARRLICDNYSWQQIAKQIGSVYDAIISQRAVPYSSIH
jgi:glycosyltransferase involved in cell wall biosynthesis